MSNSKEVVLVNCTSRVQAEKLHSVLSGKANFGGKKAYSISEAPPSLGYKRKLYAVCYKASETAIHSEDTIRGFAIGYLAGIQAK